LLFCPISQKITIITSGNRLTQDAYNSLSTVVHIYKEHDALSALLSLPRVAMLPRYMQWPFVCPSVCLYDTSRLSYV